MFPVEMKANIQTIYGVCNLRGCKSHLKRNVDRIDYDPLIDCILNLKGNKREMTCTVHRDIYNIFLVWNNN